MSNSDDDKLRQLLHQSNEIPFSNDLHRRILASARDLESKPQSRVKRRRRTSVVRFTAVIGGVAAAAALVFAVLAHPKLQMHGTATSETASSHVMTAQQTFFGLKTASLAITNVGIGAEPGYAPNSEVVATLKNTGTGPVSMQNVFAVVSFSNEPTSTSTAMPNWISFADGPHQPLQPGQTVMWYFHPVGAPDLSDLALSETPTVAFYSSQLVSKEQADVVWNFGPLKASNVQVQVQGMQGSGQSRGLMAQVEATLTNSTSHPVDVSNLLAVIWFDKGQNLPFSSDKALHFMNHVALANGTNKIAPGQSLPVYFHVVGTPDASLFNQPPHVVLIENP